MIAAGVGAFGVDGAAAALLVKKDTVVIGQAGKGEKFRFEIEMIDQPLLAQSSGDFPDRPFLIEGIGQFHADQIRDGNLYRQAAAGRLTVVAQAFAIPDPGRRQVDMAGYFCRVFHGANFG
jgi:hypothetical protein